MLLEIAWFEIRYWLRIDPFLLLIDRVPDDNTMKVILSASAAAD